MASMGLLCWEILVTGNPMSILGVYNRSFSWGTRRVEITNMSWTIMKWKHFYKLIFTTCCCPGQALCRLLSSTECWEISALKHAEFRPQFISKIQFVIQNEYKYSFPHIFACVYCHVGCKCYLVFYDEHRQKVPDQCRCVLSFHCFQMPSPLV